MKHTCSFTGHRPNLFSFGYDEDDIRCIELKKVLRNEIQKLIQCDIRNFYTGMALGVDQWAALAVLDLKKQYPSIKLVAVLPCETQANKWTPQQRRQYFDVILPFVDDAILLQTAYTPDCMFKRNRWLVDHAETLLAVHNGSKRGGTAYTMQYANQCGKRVVIIDPESLLVKYPERNIRPSNPSFRVVKGKRPP